MHAVGGVSMRDSYVWPPTNTPPILSPQDELKASRPKGVKGTKKHQKKIDAYLVSVRRTQVYSLECLVECLHDCLLEYRV